jgi:hypothetical protein
MSLVARKTRPLSRELTTFRDDRLLIVACDDTYAPKQYFNFFQVPRVQVHVVACEDRKSAAKHVLASLLEIEHNDYDELWLVLDVDHYAKKTHVKNYLKTIKMARKKGIKIAISKPSFEAWLLLHHVEEGVLAKLKDSFEVEAEIRKTIGEYRKDKLKQEHYSIEKVFDAITRAVRLDGGVGGGDCPSANTTRVYLLWKSIVSQAAASQLSDALLRIKAVF